MTDDNFIYCLEGVPDVEITQETPVFKSLEQLARQQGITSIYQTCDSIEGMLESLDVLLHGDSNFKNYEVIYLVMEGEANSICLNGYFYSIEEIAELFEGRLKGKVLHFANSKVLDLTEEEAQYFLDITGAKAVSGYGIASVDTTSSGLDKAFFGLFEDEDDVTEIVEELHERHYTLCRFLDFRLYY